MDASTIGDRIEAMLYILLAIMLGVHLLLRWFL